MARRLIVIPRPAARLVGAERIGAGYPRDYTESDMRRWAADLERLYATAPDELARLRSLGNTLIALTKNTTVVSVIGVAEISYLQAQVIEDRPDAIMTFFLIVALGFVILTLPTGLFFTRLAVAPAMATCLVLGFLAIRRRDIVSHRAWMIRAYALGLGAGTQIFTEAFGQGIFGEHVVAGDLEKAAAWVLNLAVAEWAIRRTRMPTARVQATS